MKRVSATMINKAAHKMATLAYKGTCHEQRFRDWQDKLGLLVDAGVITRQTFDLPMADFAWIAQVELSKIGAAAWAKTRETAVCTNEEL